MNARELNARQRSGDFVRATIAPANHLVEPRFGLLDGAIVVLFVLATAGLVYLILG